MNAHAHCHIVGGSAIRIPSFAALRVPPQCGDKFLSFSLSSLLARPLRGVLCEKGPERRKEEKKERNLFRELTRSHRLRLVTLRGFVKQRDEAQVGGGDNFFLFLYSLN